MKLRKWLVTWMIKDNEDGEDNISYFHGFYLTLAIDSFVLFSF